MTQETRWRYLNVMGGGYVCSECFCNEAVGMFTDDDRSKAAPCTIPPEYESCLICGRPADDTDPAKMLEWYEAKAEALNDTARLLRGSRRLAKRAIAENARMRRAYKRLLDMREKEK